MAAMPMATKRPARSSSLVGFMWQRWFVEARPRFLAERRRYRGRK
jgi:hypothetical protein